MTKLTKGMEITKPRSFRIVPPIDFPLKDDDGDSLARLAGYDDLKALARAGRWITFQWRGGSWVAIISRRHNEPESDDLR